MAPTYNHEADVGIHAMEAGIHFIVKQVAGKVPPVHKGHAGVEGLPGDLAEGGKREMLSPSWVLKGLQGNNQVQGAPRTPQLQDWPESLCLLQSVHVAQPRCSE